MSDAYPVCLSGIVGTIPWRKFRVVVRLWPAVAAALLASCSRAPEAVPESPPQAVETIVEELKDNQPQVVWHALPASYQTDMRDVIATFCAHMDPEIYDRVFRILGKGVRVLREKKDFFYKSPIALSTPMLESVMGDNWDEVVDLLDLIVTSDVASLESLNRMDPGKFLASTGHQVMERMENLRARSRRSAGPNPWERASRMFKDAQMNFVKTTNGQGILRFNSSTNRPAREVKLTQVEGRWVPSEMAGSWEERVAQAKTRLEKLSGPEFEKIKPMVAVVLSALEGAMDSLLKAQSQEEFDQTLASLAPIGGMIRSMRRTQR